jgi:alginate O-acetyltransferase complex protein AlgJ
LVDVRIPLRQEKANMLLYSPTDTHWNFRGAVLGYQAVARALVVQDPQWELLPAQSLKWQLGPPYVGDLTTLMGLSALSSDLNWLPDPPRRAALARPQRGKLLIVVDSFFHPIVPLFEMQFASTKLLLVTRGTREALLAPGLLEAEKPDVVILESLERYWTMD